MHVNVIANTCVPTLWKSERCISEYACQRDCKLLCTLPLFIFSLFQSGSIRFFWKNCVFSENPYGLWLPVARSGSGAKAPLLAARPDEQVVSSGCTVSI